ncbi:MAG: septum formation initiator family protein [Pyrinomonadaceae bacterium]
MNRAANTYWTDDRLRAQRVSTRATASLEPVREISREIVGTRTEIRRRGGLVPSWVLFGMIIMATFALCLTVTMRTHAEMRTASGQYEKINADVESLRSANATLASEVHRLRTDKRAIESAARARLNMVRANEIIVPVE